jgi:hypothetical protein
MWQNIEEIKKIIEESKNKTEVLEKLGLKNNGGNFNTLSHFIMANNVNIQHFSEHKSNKKNITNYELYKDINNFLVKDSFYKSTNNLKKKLYKLGLKEKKCEICGQDENWNGKRMSLILDHINGNRHDNRIENLQIVCPNCNATLETHCRGLNIKKEEYNICECGTKKKLNSLRCKNCYNKNHKTEKYTNTYDKCHCGEIKKINSDTCKLCKDKDKKTFLEKIKERRKSERPSYNQLLEEVNEIGYSATGRKYNVSDNSIRKWIKMYEKYGDNF